MENTVTQMLPEKLVVMRMQQVAEQDRQHQHEAVQHRHHDRRPAPLQGAAALRTTIRWRSAPHRSQRCRRRWSCASRRPRAEASRRRRSRRSRPSTRPGRLGLRPWNTREAFQTMPQATKPTALSASESSVAERAAGERPQRDRGGAEQIGGSPPFQRRDVLLPAEKQQHGSQHGRDHGGNEIKRGGIERHGLTQRL